MGDMLISRFRYCEHRDISYELFLTNKIFNILALQVVRLQQQSIPGTAEEFSALLKYMNKCTFIS